MSGYTDWKLGEPDSSDTCMQFDDSKWYGRSCTNTDEFMCEGLYFYLYLSSA